MAVGSIVDYLKGSGKDSSFAARKKLAEEYGMSGYTGTASQNTQLLGKLQSQQPAQQPPQNVTQGVVTETKTTEEKPSYKRSDTVNKYYNKVAAMERDRPDEFESRYEDEISDILNSILNRPDFKYTSEDMVNDDLYKMYRDQYMRQGNLAMRDTMGNAAALTGGYGSTYAQAAGQQAYDNYLSGLNDRALDFYDRAYQKYMDQGQDLYNQMGVVTGLDNTDYSRYRDTVNDYYTDRDYYNNRYNQELGFDYGQYQDTQAADQWAKEFAFKQQQAAQEQANWEAEMALSQQKAARSGGGGGRSSGGSSKKSSGATTKLSVNEAVTILDKIKRTEGLQAAISEANTMIKEGLLAPEKGDKAPEERIAMMVDQWEYMERKKK